MIQRVACLPSTPSYEQGVASKQIVCLPFRFAKEADMPHCMAAQDWMLAYDAYLGAQTSGKGERVEAGRSKD